MESAVLTSKTWTEADLQALPEDGYIHELVDGELVMSPNFDSGTRLAWIIDPSEQHVEICRSPNQRRLLGAGGFLEGEDLLPGFRFAVAELFEEDDCQ